MKRKELENVIFVGIVEDNNDPKKLGRIKVRVVNIFDEIPVEDLPWAKPWKDLNGNSFLLPEKGKIVSVVFDTGNPYKPEYIFAEHYNKNLENKLQTLSGDAYTSMRALVFDHKTQIYSNDTEGLKMDYKMNNINITESDINVNLKDNLGSVNIGSPTANQQAILGNNFLNWMDEFLDIVISGGLLNSGGPVVPNPALIQSINKYKALKDPKFLSKHINLVDNEYVDQQSRPADGQLGDSWKSTVNKNPVSFEPVTFNPQPGNSTDTPVGDKPLTPYVDSNNNQIDPQAGNSTPPPVTPSNNPDVDVILNTMTRKGYKILTRPYEVNIVGIRRQYEGQTYTNSFKDDLYAIYKVDNSSKWVIHKYKISTMPGFYIGVEVNGHFKPNKAGTINVKQSNMMLGRGGMGILMEAQYLNIYKIGTHLGAPAMKTTGPQKFYRDSSPGNVIKYTNKGTGWTGMLIHRGYAGGGAVNNWSEGCQVFSSSTQLQQFFQVCEEHKSRYGNSFHYTLMLERDLS